VRSTFSAHCFTIPQVRFGVFTKKMAIMIVYRMQHSAHVTRCEVEGMMRQLNIKEKTRG
jgi:hypothetical protein